MDGAYSRDPQAVRLLAGLDDVGAEGEPAGDGWGEPGFAKVRLHPEERALGATAEARYSTPATSLADAETARRPADRL